MAIVNTGNQNPGEGIPMLTARGLENDKEYSDVMIILGAHSWDVHRWVISKQSPRLKHMCDNADVQVRNGRPTYMVVIENQKLVNSDISAFIKYLYTEELEPYLATNPVKTLYIAEFFEVESLHKAAIQRLETGLQTLIDAKYWVNFRRQALTFLHDHPRTNITDSLIKVAAANVQVLVNESGSVWTHIIHVHPYFANDVLMACFPSSEPVANNDQQPFGYSTISNASGGAPARTGQVSITYFSPPCMFFKGKGVAGAPANINAGGSGGGRGPSELFAPF